MSNNEEFMSLALDEAEKALAYEEVPVGALLVIDNKIISKSHNMVIRNQDPTAHAEINVIRDACEIIRNYRLKDARIFVTLEPCTMCYGAIVHSRVSEIIFGARDTKIGACGSCTDFSKTNFFNHRPKITGGILEQKCSVILKEFFKSRRS